ncbi:putative ribonuclease H-like domain-containing protein [Tanacetum coccineum]
MAEQDIPPPTITAMKIPIIRKGEYDIWSMRMRQYICHTDHNLWECIVNGDPRKEPAPTNDHWSFLLLMLMRKSSERQTKSSLDKAYDRFQKLISQLEVHGAPISKEDINQKFLRSLPSSWNQIALIMRNKPDIDEIDIDDLYNNLSSTNEVSTASGDFRVSTAGGINQVPSTLCAHDFHSETGRNLALQEKRPVSLDKSKIECYNCHKKGHFARECRSGRNQGRRSYGDNGRSNAPTNESSTQHGGSRCLRRTMILKEKNKTKQNKAKLEIRGYEIALESLESRILIHEKNELAWGLDEFAIRKKIIESQTTELNTKTSETAGQTNAKKPKSAMLNRTGLSRTSVSTARPVCTARPSVSTARPVCTARPSVSTARPVCTAKPNFSTARPVYATRPIYPRMDNGKLTTTRTRVVVNTGKEDHSCSRRLSNPEILLQDHIVVDSGCSSHMTGNKAYLSDYEDFNGGFVAFGSDPKENHAMNKFSAKKGIKREFSVARTPQQNGVAERKNRTLIEVARNNLADSLLPIPFWAEGSKYCLLLKDAAKMHYKESEQDLQDELEKMVTQELAAKAMDDVSRQAFEEEKRRIASQKKATQATSTNKLSTDRQSVSTDRQSVSTDRPFVSTDRSNTPYVSAASTPTGANAGESSFVYLGGKIPIDASTLPNADLPIDPNMPDLEDASDTLPNDGIFNGAYDDDEDVGAVADFNNMDDTINVSPIPTLRIHKNHPKDQILGDPKSAVQTRGKIQKASSAQQALVSYISKQNRTNHKDHQNCLLACFLSQEEPKNISQALQDESWVEAMQEELLQFKLQKVWILVDLPSGKKAIGTKWEEGIDYDEVFAPVARIEAIRLFLAFASYMGFTVYQMDVKSAFLYGTIEEEVYVHQPPGFVDPAHPNKVYKVIKALYGLHQAPRAWYETLSSFLMENGFRRGTIDKTLFIKKKKSDIMLVQVYVDDIIFGSTKKSMCTEFEDLKQQPDGIFISQDKYVADILKKFDFWSIRTATTPIESNKPLVKDEDGEDVDVHVYRSMIGSLMYLTASRPDIMFAVCACARFQVTPKASHLNAVKRIFRYLKHQPKLGLWYPRDSPFELEAFSDSDYGGASLDRKSTTGGCQFLGRRLISWQCKKQTIVANSTTEAEYVAAANCCGQVLWIQNQMMDYGFNFMNTKIHIDNESTISVIKNPVAHSRTKHIEI